MATLRRPASPTGGRLPEAARNATPHQGILDLPERRALDLRELPARAQELDVPLARVVVLGVDLADVPIVEDGGQADRVSPATVHDLEDVLDVACAAARDDRDRDRFGDPPRQL